MTKQPIVPAGFAVPESHVDGGFRLELLGPRHNVADHAAWTSSIDHIRATPGFIEGDWPPAGGMTLEENLADLASHTDRSTRGINFAYSVLDDATGEVIGCVYFWPSGRDDDGKLDGPVEAASWVSAAHADRDGPLTEVVGAWLRSTWPFAEVRYRLGRTPTTIR